MTVYGFGKWGETQGRLDATAGKLRHLYDCVQNNVLQVQRPDCRELQIELGAEYGQ
jgi:hypothetical protein